MPAIADQSTSELRANLLARRQWAKKVTGWRRRDALREIREIEDELKARGEKLEGPKRAKPGQAEAAGAKRLFSVSPCSVATIASISTRR